jgi:2-succinyl-5-enolpyruvyl-6-hydroxy-3-cyclohexene-1-carboxylate synthase
VSTYHHLLADGVPEELRPQTVVAIGAIGPSLALESLVSAAEHRVRVDLWGRVIDPNRNASHVLSCDPVSVLDVVSGIADPGWAAAWHDADTMCRRGLLEATHAQVGLSGGAVAVVLNDIDWQALVVASSLPIREVDAHLTRAGPVFANRGASGIDGFVSSALGVASTHQRTLALTGDLSLLHDANGFLNDAHLDLTMVVIDNQGGGLFDSLPQARYAPSYERLFVTPPRRNLQHLADLHRARFTVVESIESLRTAANAALHRRGIELISVPVDRSYDLMVRSQLVG